MINRHKGAVAQPPQLPKEKHVKALDVFLTLAVFKQEQWTGQYENEFGEYAGGVKAFTEGPLLPLDPRESLDETPLVELRKIPQNFSWDKAYRGIDIELGSRDGSIEAEEDPTERRGPMSLKIDIPYSTDDRSHREGGDGRRRQPGFHRLFYGGPRHGSDIAARSEFMVHTTACILLTVGCCCLWLCVFTAMSVLSQGNHYHGEEDDMGNLINIYSRVALLVLPRKHRLAHMANMAGVQSYGAVGAMESVIPMNLHEHVDPEICARHGAEASAPSKEHCDGRMLQMLPCSAAYPGSDLPLPADGAARELWDLSEHAAVVRHLADIFGSRHLELHNLFIPVVRIKLLMMLGRFDESMAILDRIGRRLESVRDHQGKTNLLKYMTKLTDVLRPTATVSVHGSDLTGAGLAGVAAAAGTAAESIPVRVMAQLTKFDAESQKYSVVIEPDTLSAALKITDLVESVSVQVQLAAVMPNVGARVVLRNCDQESLNARAATVIDGGDASGLVGVKLLGSGAKARVRTENMIIARFY